MNTMKKKIAFCLDTMTLGGVEKELITVLKKIHDQYDITLLVLHLQDTEMLEDIPKDVRIRIVGIDKNYYCGGVVHLAAQRLKRGKLIEAASLVVKRCLKIGMTPSNTNLEGIPPFEDSFDVAICYHIHSALLLRYVAEKVTASRKVAWIHNDFYTSGYPIRRLRKYVTSYDEFVAVSRKVEREFRALCPWYEGGISTAYNYMDADEIRERSLSPVEDEIFLQETKPKLLTVGRFSEQKGIDLAIRAAALLKAEGIPFHWFLIGYGEQEELYRSLIAKLDVGDCFTILGKKKNPYPYIRACDIQVQPSRHEAYPLVVLEAKILRKPIVCTDFDGADEQLVNGKNGVILPLNDIPAIANGLASLIRSPETRAALTAELEKWSPEDDLKEIVKHLQ